MATYIVNKTLVTAKQIYIQIALLVVFSLNATTVFAQGSGSVYGDFPYEQSFLTTDEPDEITKPATTGSTINSASYTADGVQLTPASPGLFGAIFVNDRKFGSSNGIKIEFEYMVYGGSGADGFTIFFFDESEENPHIGSYGAAIGYTYNRSLLRHNPNDRKPGLAGAYLGIAFDSFGNFKKTRFQNEEIIGGLGLTVGGSSHVTLRGAKGVPYAPAGTVLPGMDDGYTGYPVLVTQSTIATAGEDAYVVLNENGDYEFNNASTYSQDFDLRGGAMFDDGDTTNVAYRKAFVDIYPIDGQGSGMYITVKIQHGNAITTVIDNYPYKNITKYRETAIVHETSGDNIFGELGASSIPEISDVLNLNSTIPAFLRVGFAAATGQNTDIHTIKNLRITLPGAAEAYNDFDTTQVDIPATIEVLANDLAYQGVISENMVGSSSYINPESFKFHLEDGSAPDSDYSHQAAEGLWTYDPQTGRVTFTPNDGFEGDVSIQYSIKGGLPGHTLPFADEAYRSLPATITVTVTPCPSILVWTGNTDSNWDVATNWYPNEVPSSCTDVYIPGNVAIFPNLQAGGTNECRNIYFMPGAQLGQPQRLAYEQAHVQIDYGAGSLASQTTLTKEALVATGRDHVTSGQRTAFGAATSGAPLSRGRWNMLSAPLGEVVTGDFAFGGFPFSYIKKYDADGSASSYIIGKWADFNNETDFMFLPGQGFGHYYYPYMANTPYGMDNSANNMQWDAAKNYNGLIADAPVHIDGSSEFGLAQSNGILHFPYFSDDHLSTARRMHEYAGTAATGTSTFNFFYQDPLIYTGFLQFSGNRENVNRTSAAYRFITDGWNGEYNAGTFAAGEIVLVGNPYMSALDFDEFYVANSLRIKQVYRIYQTPNTYFTYTGDGSTDRFIAPMQSFLVETASAGTLDLTFDAESMAIANGGTRLKASRTVPAQRLTIAASNPYGETSTSIRQSGAAEDGFDKNDFSLIVDKPDNMPRVYSLVGMQNGRQRALLMNTIQSNNTVIPLGVVSTYTGNITLTLTGMDNYNADIFFLDALENTEISITGLETFEHTFTHDPAVSAELEGRFKLYISQRTTGYEDNAPEAEVVACISDNDLILIASGSDKISSVTVYDLQGRSLLSREAGGAIQCRIENAVPMAGVYIARIYTAQGIKEIKIVR